MRDALFEGVRAGLSTRSADGAVRDGRRRLRLLGAAAAAASTLLAPLAARAADVNLVADDANNATTTSFNGPTNWSNATAPTAGLTYATGAFVIRTPNNATSYTFGGDSLSIDTGGRFLMKGTGGQAATVNLILNGGLADYANGADTFTQTLAGTIAVNASSTLGALVNETLVVNSTISGSGSLAFGGGAAVNGGQDLGTVVIAQDNAAFTGGLVVGSGTVLLGANGGGGPGSFANAASYTLNGGSLVLNNVGNASTADRIPDAKAVALNGGFLVLRGSDVAGVNSAETVGALSGTGNGGVTVTFGGTNAATLTAAGLTHAAGNAAFLVNGVGLGRDATSTASVGRFLVTAVPTLVGGTAALDAGINAAAKNTQIVPFLVGESSTTTATGVGTASGTANTFVTYNANTGFRPLNPTDEFTNNAIAAGTNTRITAATPSTAAASINSLVISGGDLTITDGQPLTNASGALLFTTTNAVKPSTSTGQLAFGTAEGMVTVNSGVTGTISAVLTGSGGLTKGGAGALTLSGANTAFAGGVRLTQGALNINSAAALGTGTFTIAGGTTINSNGTAGVTVSPVVAQVWNGDFTYTGTQGLSFGSGAVSLGTAAGTTRTVTVSANTLTLNGVISSPGSTVNLTKLGGGTLQLQSAASTYSGKTTVGAGTLQVPTLSNLGVAGSLGQPTTVANGTIDLGSTTTAATLLFNGTASASTDRVINLAGTTGGATLNQSATTGNVKFGGFSATGVGTKTLTLTGSTTGTGELAGSVVNSSGTGLTAVAKTGTSLWKLSGAANAYSGATTVSAGTLLFPLVASASPNSAVTVASGGILAVNAGGAGEFTNGSSGPGTIGGALGGTFGAGVTYAAGSAFGVDTTNAGGSLTYASPVTDSTGARGFAKLGSGTLVLSADNPYTGTTYVDGGTLAFSTDQTAAKGALQFGIVTSPTASAAAGVALDLTNASATFTTATVNTAATSTTATPTVITIGAGKTLTLTNGLTVGTPTGNATFGTTRTNLNVAGAGTLSVTGGTVALAAAQTTANAANNSLATVDMTGLGAFSGTNLTAFNVGSGSTADATVSLSNTSNSVTATTFNVANTLGSNAGAIGAAGTVLNLGTGTNVFTVDALNIGVSKGVGTVKWASPTSTGTLTLAPRTGTGVAIVVGSKANQGGTSAAPAGTLDLTGHVANVTASTVLVGSESGTPNGANSGTTTGTLSFGGGTFTADSLTLAQKTANSTITATATGTFNVSGGAVTINPGGSVTLGSNNSGATIVGAVNATLNLTGGSFTSNVDILDGGGSNTLVAPTSTLNVAGTAVLDMKGKNIGSSAAPIDNLSFTAGGTIRNLGTLSQNLTQNGAASILDVLSNVTAVNGNYTVTAGTTSVKPGQSLAVSGTLDLTGSSDTLLINDTAGTALDGTAYTLATFGTLAGSAHYDTVKYFNGVSTLTLTDAAATAQGGLPNGYALTYNAGSLVLSQSAVPEPTGLLPLAGGLLMGLRRRRRAGRGN